MRGALGFRVSRLSDQYIEGKYYERHYISNARRKQFRDPRAYVEQLGNVLFGLFRAVAWWVVMTTTYTSAVAIFAFITQDFSAYSQGNLQDVLRTIVTLAGVAAAVACVLGNIGGFSDVFSDRAIDEVERFRSTKERLESQAAITESLLIKYGLITEADVERHRAASIR